MHSSIRYGGADRPWLLLVHGMLSNARHWLPNRDGLGRAFNLVQVDMPGHGRSPPLADLADLTADTLIARLDAIRAGLGISQWYLCGQSFGAGLTLAYALRHPDRVVAQCFTNARVPLRDNHDADELASRAARIATLQNGGLPALRNERFHPRFARRFPPELRALLAQDAERIDLPTYCHLLSDVMPALSLRHRPDTQPPVPTLLINGRHERAFQPMRDQLAQLWPAMRIVDIDGGHSVNIENPAGFERELLAFFAAHPSVQGGDRS